MAVFESTTLPITTRSWKKKLLKKYVDCRPGYYSGVMLMLVQTGENVFIDKEDTKVRELLSSESVRAVLLRKQSQPGCARVEPDEKEVNEKPSRYTLTEKLDGTVLVAAKQKESIILLGNITVRCFRRRP